MIVLPNENEQDFLDLQNQFVLDFMPQDIAELSRSFYRILSELRKQQWRLKMTPIDVTPEE